MRTGTAVSRLLDTNVCIHLINRSAPERLLSDCVAHNPQSLRLSAITKAELLYGARHSKRVSENLQLVTAFCNRINASPSTISAEHYGLIRTDLVSRDENIPPMDLLIAATARAHDLILVTHNLRDLLRSSGSVKLEDWEAE